MHKEFLLAVALIVLPTAGAQLHKCVGNGKVVYSDQPCDSTSRAATIRIDPNANSVDGGAFKRESAIRKESFQVPSSNYGSREGNSGGMTKYEREKRTRELGSTSTLPSTSKERRQAAQDESGRLQRGTAQVAESRRRTETARPWDRLRKHR